MKDITFIIQGPLNNISLSKLDNYLKYGNVIISHWNDDNFFLLNDINKNVKIVSDKLPIEIESKLVKWFHLEYPRNGIFNRFNIYLQTITSLNGLLLCDTEFVIKVRSDEFRTNFDKFIQKIMNNPNKVITDNCFFRSDKVAKYHSSDHCFGGKTEILLKTFKNIKENCENDNYLSFRSFDKNICCDNDPSYSPEQIITTEIIKSFNDKIDSENSKVQMKKYFDIVRLKDMGDFLISWLYGDNMRGHEYREEIMGEVGKDYITNINEL